jgi:hypothetical protein
MIHGMYISMDVFEEIKLQSLPLTHSLSHTTIIIIVMVMVRGVEEQRIWLWHYRPTHVIGCCPSPVYCFGLCGLAAPST